MNYFSFLAIAALATSSLSAGLVVTETTTPDGSFIDALRDLGGSFWNQNDASAPETLPDGAVLVTTDLTTAGFGVIDWVVRTPFTMDFPTSRLDVWGIYSEAGDRNKLFATNGTDTAYIVSNKDSNFRKSSFSIVSTSGALALDLMNASQGTGPFDSEAEVIYGEATIGLETYGMFMLDDRYPSLDNHDDFIGVVRLGNGLTVTANPIPEPSTIITLLCATVLYFLIRRRLLASASK